MFQINVYTDRDYKILLAIMNKEDKTKGVLKRNGSLVTDICNQLALNDKQTCDKKVRQTLKKFIEDGLVEFGIKKGNAYTYIVTNKGIQEIKDVLL